MWSFYQDRLGTNAEKTQKRTPHSLQAAARARIEEMDGAETFFAPFCFETHQFATTGSGQREET
jgi:hypothetical protein